MEGSPVDYRPLVPILFRAFSTVVTVAVAVIVTSRIGESWQGKIVAALLVACVIAFIEWFMVWGPTHFARIRQLLDVRAVMLGTWIQTEVRAKAAQNSSERDNAFAIFTVSYSEASYLVEGRAFDPLGGEYAKFWSKGGAIFSEHGRQMSYIFNGEISEDSSSSDRSGIAWLKLSSDTTGIGKIVHVAARDQLEFKFRKVTEEWLDECGLSEYSPKSMDDIFTQDKFSVDFSRKLVRGVKIDGSPNGGP
jgi:hypothetical protein